MHIELRSMAKSMDALTRGSLWKISPAVFFQAVSLGHLTETKLLMTVVTCSSSMLILACG